MRLKSKYSENITFYYHCVVNLAHPVLNIRKHIDKRL